MMVGAGGPVTCRWSAPILRPVTELSVTFALRVCMSLRGIIRPSLRPRLISGHHSPAILAPKALDVVVTLFSTLERSILPPATCTTTTR